MEIFGIILSIIGIILSVIGIFLTVVLSDICFKYLRGKYYQAKMLKKWNPDIQVEKGVINKLTNYAFEKWHQTLEIDDDGNVTHTIDAVIVNTSGVLLKYVTFPIYCDQKNVPVSYISPWATIEGIPANISIEDYIQERSRGRIKVLFNPPLPPGKEMEFMWGYRMPKTFISGDEYYNYDVANNFNILVIEFRFSKAWKVIYANWGEYVGNNQASPIVTDNSMKWQIRFPGMGKRLEMKFGLYNQSFDAQLTSRKS